MQSTLIKRVKEKLQEENLKRTITTIEHLKTYLTDEKINILENHIINYINIAKEIDKKILNHIKDTNENNIYNEKTFNILLDLMR